MAFGVYIHIPYCLQRCTYCDFATYEQSQIIPPDQYTSFILKELSLRAPFIPQKKVETVYFGGGTPSLIPAENIVTILQMLTSLGFLTGPDTEITIEINPATIDERKMEIYLKGGVNRFSVGAQTFDDSLLKGVRREHSSQQTRDTLRILQKFAVNYSFDLLFALPGQTLDILKSDLAEVASFRPPHISPYCLTVPEGHALSKLKLAEEKQLQMFELISSTLKTLGYSQYEISNFCLPGFHSRHNSLYWDDMDYWGVGLSAHSYLKQGAWGVRFWNPSTIGAYIDLINKNESQLGQSILQFLPSENVEQLEVHQSLTDFCHVSLRRERGLSRFEVLHKFGERILKTLLPILAQQVENGLLRFDQINSAWVLTDSGILLSNQVFSQLTFLRNELTT